MNDFSLPHDHGNSHTANHLFCELKKADRLLMVTNIFKNFSDLTRLRIFLILSHQEECVTNISAMVKVTSSAISHHLNLMKKCGLIESRRSGKEVYYKAKDNEICRLLHDITEHIMAISCPAKKECCNSYSHIVKEVHDYLLDHLSERISIEELSKKFLINPTTLKCTYKEVYKMSIGAHTNMHRMEVASHLLIETDLSVMQIAKKVGFLSQSKFSASFKNIYNCTPTEYRISKKQ